MAGVADSTIRLAANIIDMRPPHSENDSRLGRFRQHGASLVPRRVHECLLVCQADQLLCQKRDGPCLHLVGKVGAEGSRVSNNN
jgi:hypothetical protein